MSATRSGWYPDGSRPAKDNQDNIPDDEPRHIFASPQAPRPAGIPGMYAKPVSTSNSQPDEVTNKTLLDLLFKPHMEI